MTAERYVTREEIAFLLGVEVRTITNYVRQHKDFPSRVRGRERDFPVRRCLEWHDDRVAADAIANFKPPAPSGLEDAERRRAIAEAELAEIKVAKARGEVVSVALVAKEIRDTFGRVRASLLAKPGEYAPRVLHLETQADATLILRQLVDETIGELQVTAGSGALIDDDDDLPPAPSSDDDAGEAA
jgi:phage terminase Nu1 subunit (DNA packaging protein)